MRFLEFVQRQKMWAVLVESTLLAILIGWVDYATGWEWSFFVFYAVPIILVVWRSGQRIGLVFAAFCAIVWWIAQIADNPYHTVSGFALAVASRFFYFGVLVIAVAAVEARREWDRARIASLEREQQLEQEILRTSEQEQQRLGRDLHDGLGPHLAAIGYAVSFLAKDLKARMQPEAEKAERVHDMIEEAIAITRGLARGVFPVQMEGSGLAISLDELANMTSALTGVSVTFREPDPIQIEDPEIGMHLYRIAQEAVNNAVKHGRARNVSISLGKGDRTTRLLVADDGEGMSDVSEKESGIGLHSMKYRARAIGGELIMDSKLGDGTVVICELPEESVDSCKLTT
jgi:signal transduction histidine kinase